MDDQNLIDYDIDNHNLDNDDDIDHLNLDDKITILLSKESSPKHKRHLLSVTELPAVKKSANCTMIPLFAMFTFWPLHHLVLSICVLSKCNLPSGCCSE